MEEVKESKKKSEVWKWILAISIGVYLGVKLFINMEYITKTSQITDIVIVAFKQNALSKSSKNTETTINVHTLIYNEKEFIDGIKRTILSLQKKDLWLNKRERNKNYLLITGQFLDTIIEKNGLGVNLHLNRINDYNIEFNSMDGLRDMLNKYNE